MSTGLIRRRNQTPRGWVDTQQLSRTNPQPRLQLLTVATPAVQDIEAVQLVRFEPGMQLTVERVSVEHDEVRLDLRVLGEDPPATTLTVRLSGPLSPDLTEAPLVEQVLSRFLAKR